MKKLAKKSTKKASVKNKVVKKVKKAKNPEQIIRLTPMNLEYYGQMLLGRHNSHTIEDLIKVYNKNKIKMRQYDEYDYHDYDDKYFENNSYKIITAFDKVLDNYGVEIIRGRTTKDLIVYSNNGDSYAYTILYYKKKYCIAGIADILEENPGQY